MLRGHEESVKALCSLGGGLLA
eukprot:COSAG04_NODE_29672_length_267_cov_0.928571_1_plen_21_part_10